MPVSKVQYDICTVKWGVSEIIDVYADRCGSTCAKYIQYIILQYKPVGNVVKVHGLTVSFVFVCSRKFERIGGVVGWHGCLCVCWVLLARMGDKQRGQTEKRASKRVHLLKMDKRMSFQDREMYSHCNIDG